MQDVMLMLWLCYHPDFPLFFSIFWGLLYSRNGWFQIPSTPRTRKCYRSAPWPDVIHHILYGCLEFIGVLNMKGLGIIIPWFVHHYIIIFLYLFVYLLKGKWLCLQGREVFGCKFWGSGVGIRFQGYRIYRLSLHSRGFRVCI